MFWLYLFLIITALGGLVVLVVHYTSDEARAARLFARTPVTTVHEALRAAGQRVRLRGVLCYDGETPLTAPFSRRRCAYYEAVVSAKVRGSRSSSHWSTFLEDVQRHRAIWVEDQTGRARIALASAKIIVQADTHLSSDYLDEPSAEIKAYLTRRGKQQVLQGELRYQEGVLGEGEQIVVYGCARPTADATAAMTGGHRVAPQRLDIVRPGPGQPVIISDNIDLTGVD